MFGLSVNRTASRLFAGAVACALLASCGVVNEFGKTSKHVGGVSRENSDNTALPPVPTKPRASAVTPLPDGDMALDVWLAAIDAAEATIDIKTFIYRPDPVGRLISGRLIAAADRGVRVRVLVDDLFHFWKGHDLEFLDSHSGITVKIFNPLDRNLPPPFNYLLDYRRVNARMHGKAIVVDRHMAIVGGRNVGSEYFRRNEDEYFSDFDVFLKGEAVLAIRDSFDLFWSDPYAHAYRDIAPAQSPGQDGLGSEVLPDPAVKPLLLDDLLERYGTFRVDATVYTDTPAKLRGEKLAGASLAGEGAVSALSKAQRSVLIATPYFIPGYEVSEVLIGLVRKGVRVRVLTNSLGSTNHPSVHAGYLKHRNRLLGAGVEIFEYRPGIVRRYLANGNQHAPVTTLHSKIILIDGTKTITGSMNFDARSLFKNSELLIELEGAALHRNIEEWLNDTLLKSSYALKLSEGGDVIWETWEDNDRTQRTTEPNRRLGYATVLVLFALTGLDSAL